jgi:hypothetical protein
VRNGLRSYFSASALRRAKYTVGVVDITLPNFINRGSKFLGSEHAVVVDDIIVFSSNPPSFAENPAWWGHEMTHVSQYEQWGVDGFAWRYMQSFGNEIEGEANRQGTVIASAQPTPQQPSGIAPALGAFGAINTRVDSANPTMMSGQVPEYFVAQCFFLNQPYTWHYLITNTSRIIVVDAFTGQWSQVGWATPPRLPGISWSFDTPTWRYAVTPDGSIILPNPNPYASVRVGRVVRLS